MTDAVFAQALQTPRMWLRCPMPADGVCLYQAVASTLDQLRQWPDSLPWAQQPQSADISEDYCQTCYAAWVMGLRWPLLMWDTDSGQLVGSIGFHRLDHDSHTWELGYWCSRTFQGQGRTVEAVQTLTAYVQQNWPDVRMLCRIDARNMASIKVALRSGFVCETQETVEADSGGQVQVLHYVLGR